jgi:hypothetical protein
MEALSSKWEHRCEAASQSIRLLSQAVNDRLNATVSGALTIQATRQHFRSPQHISANSTVPKSARAIELGSGTGMKNTLP